MVSVDILYLPKTTDFQIPIIGYVAGMVHM